MMAKDMGYIPALRYRFLTPVYDPLLRWGMREERFKQRLIDESKIRPGYKVLDLGCGTGTLTVLLKERHPQAEVIGLDGDPEVLGIARKKAAQAGVEIQFDEGMACTLPYSDSTFERVVSSLMMHHLTTEEKRRALKEAFRVLKPGGELLVVDFGKPHNPVAQGIAQVMQRMERTEDNIQGLLPEFMRAAGFQGVEILAQFMTVFGTIVLYRGKK